MKKIELEPYKGVRDFYPTDNRIHRHIFRVWEKVAESFGYEKYNASILEPLELYKAKSSEEIVSEQIYSFKDRGDREVALRPEMTPTVARMIAARWQELPAPVRWYSIPNLFRYEKPQKGRLREHWQLNVDLFGVEGVVADAEIVTLAYKVMREFGAEEKDFEVRVNSREIFNDLYEHMGIPVEQRQTVSRIIDKKDKLPEETFLQSLKEVVGEGGVNKLSYILNSGENFFEQFSGHESVINLKKTIETLRAQGINNIVFHPTLTRGFDYYTGLVFEIFDTNPENNRSVFGGGRYDNLVEQFGGEKVPAVGFGAGDVTTQDFLMTHNLLPKLNSSTDLWICVAPGAELDKVHELAEKFRALGLNVGVDISGRKLPDQLKAMDRRDVPQLLVVGKDELESGKFKIRNTETREEKEGSAEELAKLIRG